MIRIAEVIKNSEMLGDVPTGHVYDDGFVGEIDKKGAVSVVPLKSSQKPVNYATFRVKALKL